MLCRAWQFLIYLCSARCLGSSATKDWQWPRQALGVPLDIDYDLSIFTKPHFIRTWAFSGVDALRILRNSTHSRMDGLVINIGAGDSCVWDNNVRMVRADGTLNYFCDPVNEAFVMNEFSDLSGLFFEPSRFNLKHLEQLIRSRNVTTKSRKLWFIPRSATHERLQSLLTRPSFVKLSKNVEAIKIDTDSYDCETVEFFLVVMRLSPKIWILEINPNFPPPIEYSYLGQVNPAYGWPPRGGQAASSCSLAYLSKALLPFDYVLVQLDWYNAVYVKRELAQHFGGAVKDDVAYYFGWASRPDLELLLQRLSSFRGFDHEVRPWREAFLSSFGEQRMWMPRDTLAWQAFLFAKKHAGDDAFTLRVPMVSSAV